MTEPDISQAELRRLRQRAMEGVSVSDEVVQEIARLTSGNREYIFRPETRCRVCRDVELARTVNRLLTLGLTYQTVLERIEILQREVPPDERVTYNSLYHHARKHFPLEETSRSVMREIIERRAQEHEVDFVKGVASAVTPLAYLEAVMVKGFEAMATDSGDAISPELGMKAAEKLHALTAGNEDQRRSDAEIAQIIEAVRSTVPQNMWGEIVQKLDKALPPGGTIDAEIEEY